jgi:hypothetical protein
VQRGGGFVPLRRVRRLDRRDHYARMSYDHVVALVDYVAGAVANALARN